MFRTSHKYQHLREVQKNHRACDCVKANIIDPQLHNEFLALVKYLRFSSNLVDMKSQYAKGNKPFILHITSLKNVPTLLFSLWNSTAVRLTVVAFPDLSQDVGLSF